MRGLAVLAGTPYRARRLTVPLGELPRWSVLASAGSLAVAGVLVFPRGGTAALVVLALATATIVAAASFMAAREERGRLLLIALLGGALHFVLVGAIDVALMLRDARWYAPDERVYLETAAALFRHWADPTTPLVAENSYVNNSYVHLIARMFQLFGENLVIVKLVNAFLGAVTALFGYRIMRDLGMPGAWWAPLLILLVPSMALWNALALKDAYVGFFVMASVGAASRYIRTRNALWLVAALLVLIPLQTVRLYILVSGALTLLAVPFALRSWRARLTATAVVVPGVALLLALVQPLADQGPNIFYRPIEVRSAAADGARSSFVEPRPALRAVPGEQYQVAVAATEAPAAGATAGPSAAPRVVVVQPGTEIIVALTPTPAPRTGSPSATMTPGTTWAGATPTPAVVRPGDIVFVAPATSAGPTSAATSAAPTASPTVVVLDTDEKNVVGLAGPDPDEVSIGSSLLTNLRHLPVGVLHTLLAPFPWTARTPEQVATIPEMLGWYAALVLALVGSVSLLRRRDLRYAQGLAWIIGLIVLLSLISANTGTLIRSRAMLVPFVLILTAVGIDVIVRLAPRLRPLRSPE